MGRAEGDGSVMTVKKVRNLQCRRSSQKFSPGIFFLFPTACAIHLMLENFSYKMNAFSCQNISSEAFLSAKWSFSSAG